MKTSPNINHKFWMQLDTVKLMREGKTGYRERYKTESAEKVKERIIELLKEMVKPYIVPIKEIDVKIKEIKLEVLKNLFKAIHSLPKENHKEIKDALKYSANEYIISILESSLLNNPEWSETILKLEQHKSG